MNYLRNYGSKARLGISNVRILVTGGLGFIGSRLCIHLKQQGHSVTIGSRSIIAPPNWFPQADFVNIDWEDDYSLAHACEGIDVVFHAAGMNSKECMEKPIKALQFNGLCTARLLEQVGKSSATRFIYLSTAHVYASPLAGVINEYTCPQNKHPYATSHLAAENIVLDSSRHPNIERIVVRLSNVYGAPVNPKANCWMLLVNDLCRQAIKHRHMVLKTSGIQQRDFVPMTKVVEILSSLASQRLTDLSSNILNIGSGNSMTVLEMTRLIKERCEVVMGYIPKINTVPIEVDEQTHELSYGSLFLTEKHFHKSTDIINSEIDRLLHFCDTHLR